MNFKVRIDHDQLVFCSGHFITFDGDNCESVHGHNFRASVELEAPMDDNHYVFDFLALKKYASEIVKELDHVMLLPLKNPYLKVEADDKKVQVLYQDREWRFPRSECVLLPIENTTAELLAQIITQRLLERLDTEHQFRPTVLRVEVEEDVGQSAICEWRESIG